MYLRERCTGVFFCETMNGITSIIRGTSGNLNDNTIFRSLVSAVDHYNELAKSKGLPVKRKPSYNRHMNDVLMKRLISNIIKDIDRIKNVKGDGDKEVNREVLTGVIFESNDHVYNRFMESIWKYTKEDENTVNVTLNTEEFSNQFTGETVTLDYKHMPYERLIDTEGNEYSITSYNSMFSSLLPDTVKSLIIQNWTNTNVTDMSWMFGACSSLQSLTLGDNFNTSNVTTMSYMFSGCSFELLTLSDKFNTSNTTNMSYMFYNCSELTSLTLGDNFDTSKVENMWAMFSGCSSLESLTIGDKFNTSNTTSMSYMFNGCSSFTSLTLYRSAELIITQLPTATWIVNSSPDNTITTQQGLSAAWNPSTLPGQWGDDQWTFSRTL